MELKPEQVKEVQDAVADALNYMLPKFVGSDTMSKLTSAMEAGVGHVDFPDGRIASITLRVEIETMGAEPTEIRDRSVV